MDQFKLGNEPYFIELKLTEVIDFPYTTDVDGGYAVRGDVSIQSGKYYVKDAEIWFTTGRVYELYVHLQKVYKQLKGIIHFSNRDDSLNFTLKFNQYGQILVHGHFQELPSEENRLEFEFQLDQSYLPKTLTELKNIIDFYGDMKGIKGWFKPHLATLQRTVT